MPQTTDSRGDGRTTPREQTSRGTRTSSPPPNPGLVLLIAGEEHFATYELPNAGIVTIGRAEENTICIEEPTLSRQHARLSITDDLTIEDCGSANGTHLHNSRLDPGLAVPIELNEAAVLGSVTIIVQRRSSHVERRMLRSNDYFEERLYDECARAERYASSFSVAHVLLDGDLPSTVLQSALATSLRPSDIVGLYGPRQLDLLLLEATSEIAGAILERLIGALRSEGVEARRGIASYGPDGRTPAKLLGAARARAREILSPELSGDGSFIVRDPAMAKIHELVRRIATAELTVLVLGETGVGKEVIAEMLHGASKRTEGPLIRLNCAALSQSLLESELFGHERGSFTGALETKKGLLEVGAGGTVFLDEVGEMPLDTQVKLLRVLEEREVMRVGGTKSIPVDVRFVAATHRDLEAAIEVGKFRADLFYRLNAFSIVIPPLRDRRSEIEPLATFFVSRVCHQLDRSEPEISREVIELLVNYGWPGNIRELRNAVERAAIIAVGDVILPQHLPEKLRGHDQPMRRETAETPILDLESKPRPALELKRRLSADQERDMVVAALEKTGGNQTQAARLLGVSRRTLMNKLDRYKIPRPRKKG